MRDIGIPVQRALKKYGTSLASGEMKASSSGETVILRLLTELVKQYIQIVATAVDQTAIFRAPKDSKEILVVQFLIRSIAWSNAGHANKFAWISATRTRSNDLS